jgi:hypothetical protein
VERIATARRRIALARQSPSSDSELNELHAAAERARLELAEVEKEFIELSGISVETIEAIEQERIKGDPIDRTPRRSVTEDAIPPTGYVDEILPRAVERFARMVGADWLGDQRLKGGALDAGFLVRPFSLIRGIRVASEQVATHRLAQSIMVAEDYMGGRSTYDWHAGASLIPQFTALEVAFDLLKEVGGDIQDRITTLWSRGSEFFDSTVFELLVAAACVRNGRTISSLPVTPGVAKTPDFEVHGYPFPKYVECKRRQSVLASDLIEDEAVHRLFAQLRSEAQRLGMWGVAEVQLLVEPEALVATEVIAALSQQRFAIDPVTATQHGWGNIAFRELPSRFAIDEARLYGPSFLRRVFGWNTDLPTHDGIICQVDRPEGMIVSDVREPFALVWNSDSPANVRRRLRSIAALFGAAVKQLPAGSSGIIYAAYNEGNRPDIADNRVALAHERLHEWEHEWHIRIPISFMIRLIPRPLGNGSPDLVETAMRLVSGAYGSPAWFADFPTQIFTSAVSYDQNSDRPVEA